MTESKNSHDGDDDKLDKNDAPAPGDALGIDDMGGNNRSNMIRPKGGPSSPASKPKAKD